MLSHTIGFTAFDVLIIVRRFSSFSTETSRAKVALYRPLNDPRKKLGHNFTITLTQKRYNTHN